MTGKLVAAYPPRCRRRRPCRNQPPLARTGRCCCRRANWRSCADRSGDSNKEIARTAGIAETTVKIHVQHILRKLDVSSRVHAAVIATGTVLTA
jgi:two-component system nitrate/nitrite response regulator NarL